MSIATQDPVTTAIDAAIRAPSPQNTQPWRFEVDRRRIEVSLDLDRILTVADPEGREARLSCGAAILNLRLALRAAGRIPLVHLLPPGGGREHLATVWERGAMTATPDDLTLARAIPCRRSNRRAFTAREVPVWVRQALVQAAMEEGAHLAVVGPAGPLDALSTLVREAERQQREDPAFQDEVRRWTATDGSRDDGVPAVANENGPAWPFDRTPLVAVLSSYTDTPLAQVRAGQALQRVLLRATTAGVSVSFLSQPIEIPALRATVGRLVAGPGNPQLVLRFGYGFAAPPTRRRPAAAVTRYLGRG